MSTLLLLIGCSSPPGPGARFGDDSAWGLTFGGAETDEAWGIAPAEDGTGDVFVGMHLADPVLTDAFLFRLDPAGAEQWQTQWGGVWSEQVFMLAPAGDAVLVSGITFHGAGPTDADAMITSLGASAGELRWEWTWDGGAGWDEVDGLGVDEEGGVFLSGWTTGSATSNDLLLGRLDAGGEADWLTSWGGSGWDEANGHLVLQDDAVVVAGLTGGLMPLVGGDMTLAGFSREDGAALWSATAGEASTLEDALGLCGDGARLYAVGYAPGVEGVMDLTVWATDHEGGPLWQWQWGAGEWAGGRAITIDPNDGSVVVAGNTSDPLDGVDRAEDLVLARLDPETGALLQTARWGGSGSDVVHDLAADEGGLWLVGETDSLGAGKLDALLLRVGGADWDLPPEP